MHAPQIAAPGRFTKKIAANEQDDDFHEIEIRGRRVSIFRRLVGETRTGNYYVKVTIGTKQVYRGTGESSKGRAIEAAKLIVHAAMDGRWDALRETKLRQAQPVATIGQLIDAHQTKIADFAVAKDKTLGGYRNALRAVLRGVHEGDVERLSSRVLTEELAEKYFAARVKGAQNDLLERDRRIRGANSTLNQARMMFTPAALKCYRGLTLPDVKGFLQATTAENPAVQHETIEPETIRAIAQAALQLREENPSLYLVHLCFRHLGMRNDEIEHARVGWIERRTQTVHLPDGEQREIAAAISIKRRRDWVPKRGIGSVPIAPDVLAEIDALIKDRTAEDHLIPARTATDRAALVDRDHADFIRPWVGHHNKVSYELRRWGATLVAMRQGQEFADRFLRHAATSVAGKHYLTQHVPPAPITLADCGL